jgi:hypothetical protein
VEVLEAGLQDSDQELGIVSFASHSSSRIDK